VEEFGASLLKAVANDIGRALRIAVPLSYPPTTSSIVGALNQHGFESPTGTDGMYTVQAVEWFAA
jgi:hypothetical protein